MTLNYRPCWTLNISDWIIFWIYTEQKGADFLFSPPTTRSKLSGLTEWVSGWVGVGLLCVTHRGAEPQVQSSWCLDEHRGSVWAADFHFSSFTAACYHIKDGSLSIRRGNRSKGLSSQPITFKYGLLKTDLQTLQFRNPSRAVWVYQRSFSQSEENTTAEIVSL